jgi:hypothetical protein
MPERQRMTTQLKTLFQRPELFLLAGGINPIGAKMAEALGYDAFYSYCVIELDKRRRLCAARYSMDIAPGWLRERRSGVGGSSRLSLRHVVRDGPAAPRGLQFWETPSVAN